jgi:hypothetical protein
MLSDEIGNDSIAMTQLPEQNQHIFMLQGDPVANRPDAHLNLGRVLASARSLPRKLNEKGDNIKVAGEKGKLPKKKLHAKLIFDQELQKFYDEISLIKPDDKFNHIFRIQKDPIDFDGYLKVWGKDSGIHPDHYHDLKFEMDKQAFYKLLFQYRKPDLIDPNLSFFLADFTPAFIKDIKIDLRTDFKIDPSNFVIGKQKKLKTERVLAVNPERVLIEDFAHKTIFGDSRIHH